MLRLVFPSIEHKQDCLDYIKEHYDNQETEICGDGGLSRFADFGEWVKNRENSMNKIDLPPDKVPSTTFLAYTNQMVGIIDIRHYLNDHLLQHSGHIGYSVRPSQRRKGFAREMLMLALQYCKYVLHLKRVLVTCARENEASRRTILANGGVLENEIYSEVYQSYTQRYWIDIK